MPARTAVAISTANCHTATTPTTASWMAVASSSATTRTDVDDVEYLYSQHPEPFVCQLCNRNLDHYTHEERADHYAVHFAQQEQEATGAMSGPWYTSMSGGGASPKSSVGKTIGKKLSNAKDLENYSGPVVKDIFWHPLLETVPPKNCTPGLIPVIKRSLIKLQHKNLVKRAVICSDGVTHICGQLFDRAWSCGYRNFLMASTALATQQTQPLYFALLETDPKCGPGVRNLQRWIEEAWKLGYDEVGAQQLKHKLFGTRKWIGTGELYVAFTYKGIPSCLVDFPKSNGTSSRDTASALTRWIVDYFSAPGGVHTSPTERSANSPPPTAFDMLKDPPIVSVTSHMPVILQHNGHSRTIIGYEVARNGAINLLIFDPAKDVRGDLRKAALAEHARAAARRKASSMFTPPTIRNAPSSSSTHSSSSKTSVLSKFFHRDHNNTYGKSSHPPVKGVVLGKRHGAPEPIEVESDDEVQEVPYSAAKRPRGNTSRQDNIVEIEVDEVEVEELPPKTPLTSPIKKPVESFPEEDILDPHKVLSYFRISVTQLSKNDEYQILYFPLSDPLTEHQKERRKIVTSERVVP